MPLPMVLAAAGAALAGLYAAIPESVKNIGREEIDRALAGELDDFLNEALTSAFERIGLQVDPDGPLTPESLTKAINDGPLAGSGIQFTNVFDREACKRDITRVAIAHAAGALGVTPSDMTVDGLRATVKSEITKRVMQQLGEGAGEYLEAAPDLVALAKALDAGIRAGLIDSQGRYIEPGIAMDAYHVSLRERQAKYRAQHTRHWEPIGNRYD